MSIRFIQIIKTASHRNGVAGAPFQVTIFQAEVDDEKRVMLAIDFEHGDNGIPFAVLDFGLLDDRTIGFGANSWRGDQFARPVRDAIAAYNPETSRDV